MKNKYCIFDKNKLCDDCGECYKCELNPNKICDNCGKCLEIEGYDIKEIKIDEVLKTQNEINEYNETLTSLNAKQKYTEQEKKLISEIEEKYGLQKKATVNDDIKLEYIEDNLELLQMLTDKKKGKNKDVVNELYPGLITIKKKK